DLANRLARGLRCELEHRLRLVGGQPADQVHHPARLLRRNADVPRLSPGFHWCVSPSQAYRRLRRSSLTWLRKVRVGANSPSLCPTIDSVMNTGMCLRPSWTAMVWPTMSGMIVERRDHVLMTFLSPAALRTSTFWSRWSSTNGPFLRLR